MARAGRHDMKRVLLKLSGELFRGPDGDSIDPDAVGGVARQITDLVDEGVELAVVLGAGNIFRGRIAESAGMNRASADYMGMLATVVNALALQDALESLGAQVLIQSAIPVPGIARAFDHRQALRRLAKGDILIFAGGTGHPYFTTDTTAALRACEIGADAILKGTKVRGVFSSDPETDPAAVRYAAISYTEALEKRLLVMDSTAFSLCMDNRIPIIVFRYSEPGVLRQVMNGDMRAATIVHGGETQTDNDAAS